MKNILSLILIVFSSVICFGQDTFQFNLKFLPKSSYQTNMDMKMKISMKIDSDDESLKNINNVETIMDINTQTLTQTKEIDAKGDLPFVITYTKLNTASSVNGQALPPTDTNILLGVKINGVENKEGRKFALEAANGELVQMKDVFDNMLNTISLFVFYPKNVFKIGESYKVDVPFKVPLQEGLEFEMNFQTVYTLRKLEKGNAYFDVEMKSIGDIKTAIQSQYNIKFEDYKLKGNLMINILDQNIIQSDFSGPMILTMDVNDVKVKMTSENKYIINTIKL